MQKIMFESFDSYCSGKMITEFGDTAIVQARNPYGSHNLVAVQMTNGGMIAFRHGNLQVFDWCNQWAPIKQFRKVFAYLVKKGIINQSTEVVGWKNYGERCE